MKQEEIFAFLNRQKRSSPHAAFYQTFEDLYDRKLWHQLTVKLLEFSKVPMEGSTELIEVYNNFIADFADKINQRSYALLTIATARTIELAAGFDLLNKTAETVKPYPDARALLCSEIAHYELRQVHESGCKTWLEEAQKALDSLAGVDPEIHATYYDVAADYDKARLDYVNFYKNRLLYLSCSPLITPFARHQHAMDMAIAALLGSSIYNFGELLASGLLTALDTDPAAMETDQATQAPLSPLHKLLRAIQSGDLATFGSLLQPVTTAYPILKANETFLVDKARLMSLIELLFRRDANHRTVSFADIAKETGVAVDAVEWLLMKAMSLKLMRGTIDQVTGVIHVTHVQPRVLDMTQIASLSSRLQGWSATVQQQIKQMEMQTPELFVQ